MFSPAAHLIAALTGLFCFACVWPSPAAPRVEVQDGAVRVAGNGYRASFVPESAGFHLELRDADGHWQPVAVDAAGTTLGLFDGREDGIGGRRATWALREVADGVLVGQQVVLDARRGLALEIPCACTDRGLLLGTRLSGPQSGDRPGWLWSPPRFRLDPQRWAEYRFWDAEGRLHEGRIAALDPWPAYAGISPWEQRGDTVAALDAQHPALIVQPADGVASNRDATRREPNSGHGVTGPRAASLAVWGQWRTRGGHIDLTDNQLLVWRLLVRRGQQGGLVASRRAPTETSGLLIGPAGHDDGTRSPRRGVLRRHACQGGQRPIRDLDSRGLNATGPNIVELEQRGIEFLSPAAASEAVEGNPAVRTDPRQPVPEEAWPKLPISPQTKKLDKSCFVFVPEENR